MIIGVRGHLGDRRIGSGGSGGNSGKGGNGAHCLGYRAVDTEHSKSQGEERSKARDSVPGSASKHCLSYRVTIDIGPIGMRNKLAILLSLPFSLFTC